MGVSCIGGLPKMHAELSFGELTVAAMASQAPAYAKTKDTPVEARTYLDLSIGEARVSWPQDLVTRALADGAVTLAYSDPQGMLQIREAYLSTFATTHAGLTAENILVTSGAKQALWAALCLYIRPGMTVLIPSPGWPLFRIWVEALQANVATYSSEGPLAISIVDALDRFRPDAVIVNSPTNPTGQELSPQDVGLVADRTRELGTILISDEVYREFGNSKAGFAHLISDPDRIVFVVDSISKWGAAAGLRVGFLAGGKSHVARALLLRSAVDSCPPTLTQAFALTFLLNGNEFRFQLRQFAKRAVAGLHNRLESSGVDVISSGGIYIWAHASNQSPSFIRSQGKLLRGVEGGVFGGTGRIRLCPVMNESLLLQYLGLRWEEGS